MALFVVQSENGQFGEMRLRPCHPSRREDTHRMGSDGVYFKGL